jgi:hypothetical protein
MTRRFWTGDEVATLRRLYATHTAHEISELIGWPAKSIWAKAERLGLRKPVQAIAERARRAMADPNHPGRRTQWGHGRAPWNLGRKGMPSLSPATVFKPGKKPQTWCPVGSTRIVDGILQRKLADTGYSPADYVPVHRTVWEDAHGPVPAGMIVVFRPGRKTHDEAQITVDALECITRAANMLRNSSQRYGREVHQINQLRGAITRQINLLSKRQQDPNGQ